MGGHFNPVSGRGILSPFLGLSPGNSRLVITIPGSQESRLKSSRLEHSEDQTASKIVRVMTLSGSTKPAINYSRTLRHLSRVGTFNDDAVKTPNLTKYEVSQLMLYLHVQLKMESITLTQNNNS